MPESKKDQSLRTRAEVANFLECGDARGTSWLARHPGDVERAARVVEARHAAHDAATVVPPESP